MVWFSQWHITRSKQKQDTTWYGSANRSAVLEMTNKDGGAHEAISQALKEYEIITLIYNRKSCSLGFLSLCAPVDIFL